MHADIDMRPSSYYFPEFGGKAIVKEIKHDCLNQHATLNFEHPHISNLEISIGLKLHKTILKIRLETTQHYEQN